MSSPSAPASPRITALSWGRIDTSAGSFRDAKLWPGGGRNWDWAETGTNHDPGVQPADVEEILSRGAEVVVIGRGQAGRLQVTEETLHVIERSGARPEVLVTREAIGRYNRLVDEGRAVGAVIHSSC